MRSPVALGFYPQGKKELEGIVKKLLVSAHSYDALGIVVPHAGYVFSGSVAGKTYASCRTDKSNFVIFCPNHTGYGEAIAASADEWNTPLGTIKTKGILTADEKANKYEHSAEVQLPFLQMLHKNFTFSPVCLKHLEFEEIEKLSEKFDESNFYIASSDFIHYGPNYGYEPVERKKSLEWVKEKESELIELICDLNAKKFYDAVEKNNYTVCGYIPITLLLLVMKKLGAKKGIVIGRKTSYEVHKSDSFVSYAGIVFT